MNGYETYRVFFEDGKYFDVQSHNKDNAGLMGEQVRKTELDETYFKHHTKVELIDEVQDDYYASMSGKIN